MGIWASEIPRALHLLVSAHAKTSTDQRPKCCLHLARKYSNAFEHVYAWGSDKPFTNISGKVAP